MFIIQGTLAWRTLPIFGWPGSETQAPPQEEIDEATQVRSNEDSTSESLVGFGRSREDRSSLVDPPFSGIYTFLISV